MAQEPHAAHPKHRIMDYHGWFCSHIQPEWRVLDVGCGSGALAVDLAKHCREVIAVDLLAANIDKAERCYASSNLFFCCGDALEVYLPQSDAIVLSNVLEHIKARDFFLRRMSTLSPRLLIRVPLIDRDWLPLFLHEQKVPYFLDATHELEYTLELLEMELLSAGFVITEHRVKYGEAYVVALQQGQ